jgi:hypothetical protein
MVLKMETRATVMGMISKVMKMKTMAGFTQWQASQPRGAEDGLRMKVVSQMRLGKGEAIKG